MEGAAPMGLLGAGRVRAGWAAVRRKRGVSTLCLLATSGLVSVTAPTAVAKTPPSFTWIGGATFTSFESAGWTESSNWEGGKAPEPGAAIGTLTFPRLTDGACLVEEPTESCYLSFNDVKGLTAESMQVYDGEDYAFFGEELGLGSGGLTDSPTGGSGGPAGTFMLMPLRLDTAQRWTLADRSGGSIGENGLLLGASVNGSSSSGLTIEQSNGSLLVLEENETEAGPVTIEGSNASGERLDNGVALLVHSQLNSSDGQPVLLKHIYFEGIGAVGALQAEASTVVVGSEETEEPEGITASSVSLGAESDARFQIDGSGTAAGREYSQIVSAGPVDLSGDLVVELRPREKGKPCPVPAAGTTYTLVTANGPLSGAFENAPEAGAEIPIALAGSCNRVNQTMRISYHRSGGLETVTGTVEAAAKERQEHAEREAKERTEREATEKEAKKEAEEAQRKASEEGARRAAEEESKLRTEERLTQKKHEEEAAAAATSKRQEEEAAIAKKHQEERAAEAAVLGVKEVSPDATIASASLAVSPSGAFVIKIECPAGEASCTGTITLRTLHAVSAGVSGREGKSKAAIVTLASGSFAVAGGQSKALTLHLSATGRKLLAHSHVLSARATVVAHNPAGGTHTGQAIVTLRPQKRKRH